MTGINNCWKSNAECLTSARTNNVDIGKS